MRRLKRKKKDFLKAFLRDKHECQMEMRKIYENVNSRFWSILYRYLQSFNYARDT